MSWRGPQGLSRLTGRALFAPIAFVRRRMPAVALLAICLLATVLFLLYWQHTSAARVHAPPRTSPVTRAQPADAARAPAPFALHGPCSAGFVPRPSQHGENGIGRRARHMCEGCPAGTYSLPGWSACEPLLMCRDIAMRVTDRVVVAHGGVKTIHRAQLEGAEGSGRGRTTVMLATCHSAAAIDDFLLGIDMLQRLAPHPNVVQIVGYCKTRARALLVTEWLPHGSGDDAGEAVKGRADEWILRRRLALDYVRAILHLHAGPTGTYVMCDSNSPSKALSQFLLTPDARLKLNDVDAVPPVRKPNVLVKCGHRRLGGRHVAPEQHWPWPSRPFVDGEMPGYDEKTDVWKMPDVIERLLDLEENRAALGQDALSMLDDIREACKRNEPARRPDAIALMSLYRDALWCEGCEPLLSPP